MSVIEDEGAMKDCYEDIRCDSSENTWCAFGYEGKKVVHRANGTEYADLLELCADDERIYAYVRFETGDEMSKRAKFAFITWIGCTVRPLMKAKVSTDKAFVKKIMVNFGKELLCDEKSELKYEKVLAILEKASGAAYGTGK